MPDNTLGQPAAPKCQYTREVRFAVVMYGGVSLAIYMNGITQELLHLIRATAPADNDAPDDPLIPTASLSGTERVYRKLGQMLGNSEDVRTQAGAGDPIRTRFMIDILSGTSAGGINAIFLAKALANNQTLDGLKQLWVEEGDLSLLLNDKESVKQQDALSLQKPPQSLLNSQRMYLKLLKALDDMEQTNRSVPMRPSPFCGAIDLFVTATDIRGVSIPLRLADKVVYERRHKNVFHFRYYTTSSPLEADADFFDLPVKGGQSIRNDFITDYNPFLAFAARCTSSFPFAFEPMCLDDIDGIIGSVSPYSSDPRSLSSSDRWERFIENYRVSPEAAALPFSNRSFGDGGYLDNKPFSYAIDALMSRQANFPVDRKLIYIEPAPEQPGAPHVSTEKPDAIENVNAALLVLPRYETIREDLQRVLQRNNLIERINRITRGIEADVKHSQKRARPLSLPGAQWASQDLAEMIKQKGIAYGGYQRLKVGAVTDELAELIARASGLDEDSDQLLGIRYLVRAWRSLHYTVYNEGKGSAGKETENKFLLDFDISYRLRRLIFVQGKLDVLHGAGEEAQMILENIGVKFDLKGKDLPEFQKELLETRVSLNKAFTALNGARNALKARHDKNPLHDLVVGAGISPDQIKDLLNEQSDSKRLRKAESLLGLAQMEQRLTQLAAALAEFIHNATVSASGLCTNALDPEKSGEKEPAAKSKARQALWHYYQFYDDYDMVTFPVLYSADAGELDTVEVLRISPEDETSLINEAIERPKPDGRQKLAGTTLGNFGAFLDKAWRQNDILWGRLDGAERIIGALLPGPDNSILRNELIAEAQEEILKEDLRPQDRSILSKLLTDALVQSSSEVSSESALRKLVEKELGKSLDSKAEALFRMLLQEKSLLEYFHTSYQVNRQPDPESTLKMMSRATRIVGSMLDGLSERHNVSRTRVAWISRFGQIFWGFVIVAVPGSMLNLVVVHWLKVLYAFEALLVAAATIFTVSPMQQLGLTLFGVTAGSHLIIAFLHDYMQGKKFWRRMPVLLFAILILLLAALGVDALFGHPVLKWMHCMK